MRGMGSGGGDAMEPSDINEKTQIVGRQIAWMYNELRLQRVDFDHFSLPEKAILPGGFTP